MSMRFLTPLVLLLVALFVACGGSGGSSSDPSDGAGSPTSTCEQLAPLSPDTVTVKFSTSAGATKRLITQLADTPSERAQGLMNRTCLPENEGMLFAYHGDASETYWMKDTQLPLTIAFIQADGTIVAIDDMQPETTDPHGSPQPYRYAVEANQGWYAENGISVGDKADIHTAISDGAED